MANMLETLRAHWATRKGAATVTNPANETKTRRAARATGKLLLLGIAILPLYYGIGMIVMNRIDDNLQVDIPVTQNGSKAVDTVIAMLTREVKTNAWTPNDPFFMPSVLLDNTPNYQIGMLEGIRRFSRELADLFSRQRGTSEADEDLEFARGSLETDPTIWLITPTEGQFQSYFLPKNPAEGYYSEAIDKLASYNRRVANGAAVFVPRNDNVIKLLDRIAQDLGASSASIDIEIESSDFLLDSDADDLFYRTKGRLYAYALILRALGQDARAGLETKQATGLWDEMVELLERAAVVDPLVVVNGKPDSLLMPSHLTAQGFYVLRARAKMTEIRDVLDQ